MRSTPLRASLALVLAAFTGACGDSGSTGPSFADSVSTEDALDMAGDAAASTSVIVGQMNFGSPQIFVAAPENLAKFAARHGQTLQAATPRFALGLARPASFTATAQLVAAEGCTLTMRGMNEIFGDFVDVNQNEIPDDAFIRVECVHTDSTTYPDSVITTTEFEELSIKERFGDLYGYDAALTLGDTEEDEFGNRTAFRIEMEDHLSIETANAAHRASFKLTQDSTTAGAELRRRQIGESWNAEFTPDGVIALNNDLPDGLLSFEGRRFLVTPDGPNISFTIETTTPLAYSALCADEDNNPPFTAGTILGRLNNSSRQASFEITFEDCGDYFVDVDGAYDEVTITTAGR
jgi:hypothetical protein